MIDSAVHAVYSKYKAAKFQNRINSINKVVQQNGTVHTQEMLSLVLMKASIMLAESKERLFEEKATIMNLVPEKPTGFFSKVKSFVFAIKDKIMEIADWENGQQIKLYNTEGGKEALNYVMLILLWLENDHENIVRLSLQKEAIPLDLQIANHIYEVQRENVDPIFKDGDLEKLSENKNYVKLQQETTKKEAELIIQKDQNENNNNNNVTNAVNSNLNNNSQNNNNQQSNKNIQQSNQKQNNNNKQQNDALSGQPQQKKDATSCCMIM